MSETDSGLTPSERLVAGLCERAFLRFWTHPSPIGKKGKELCDCLIVCGAHVVIISVKEIEYRDTEDTTGWERWQKAVVDKSIAQIRGAERWLRTQEKLVRKDGREISLPPHSERKYHRLSVSLGGCGEVPLQWGDLGNGFVHLLEEFSLIETFRELDTITDFIAYLDAVESLLESGVTPLFSGGGLEDLLAMYVRHGPTFGVLEEGGDGPDMVIVEGGLWKQLTESPEYKERNKELESSSAWDRLIDHFASDLLTDGLFDMHRGHVTKNELALVAMAR